MTFIPRAKLAEPLDDTADARLPSTVRRWTARLPHLFLNWVIAGTALAIGQLPGMPRFRPTITVIGIAFHNIVATTAWAKRGITSSLRWLRCTGSLPFGLQLTSRQVIEIGGGGLGVVVATVRASFAATIWIGELLGVEPNLAQLIAAGTSICGASAVIATNTHDEDVAYAIACITVFGTVAMFAHPIPADAKAWIVAGTTFLQSIALAAMRLETNIVILTAKGFRPALLGALAFLFTAGFSLSASC
jgi:uncharacterized membrane protein YadS